MLLQMCPDEVQLFLLKRVIYVLPQYLIRLTNSPNEICVCIRSCECIFEVVPLQIA